MGQVENVCGLTKREEVFRNVAKLLGTNILHTAFREKKRGGGVKMTVLV